MQQRLDVTHCSSRPVQEIPHSHLYAVRCLIQRALDPTAPVFELLLQALGVVDSFF